VQWNATSSPQTSGRTTYQPTKAIDSSESMRFIRAYPTDLALLRDLLPQVETPVQIIAGGNDSAVPKTNAEFLHERILNSKLDFIDAGHFVWEDAADEYASLVASWWNGGFTTADSARSR
jgi:pimeloyl-ACP methyl ester carboxylesterase